MAVTIEPWTDEELLRTGCPHGRARLEFLRDYHPEEYRAIAARGNLEKEKLDTERAARERLDRMIPAMARSAGLTEEMKRADLLEWAGQMNAVRAQAEEIVYHELVYA